MNAGQIIAETLKLYDTEYFFALTGGDADLFLGLRDAGIKSILPHSERAGVAMADGYSRVSGKPSFSYGQAGPGASVCVSGLVDAYWAYSPVVCITGSLRLADFYRYRYQAIENQNLFFEPITKWNAWVPNIERLADMLRMAIREAVSGAPGPVHLDVPTELIMLTKSDLAAPTLYAETQFKQVPACRVAPAAEDIEKTIAVIAQSKKPLILAGGGVIISEAWNDLIEFAESLSIPVVTSSAGKFAMATDHPLAVGVVGNYSRKVANDVATQCDAYIVIGSNMGDHTTKGQRVPGPKAKIVHIDADPAVLGTNYREEVSVVGDAKLALQALKEAAQTSGLARKTCPWSDWVKEVQKMVKDWKQAFRQQAEDGGGEGAINPYFVMDVLNKVLGPDDILVADTGFMAAFCNASIDVKSPGRKYLRAAGSLGWALPASVGAQCAVKDKARVVCVTGDGGAGYHAPDIETAARYGLPVLFVVLNNSSLGFEYHLQKRFYNDDADEANNFLKIDYGAVGRAFGAYGDNVVAPGLLEKTLRQALDSGKPAVVDVTTDIDVHAPIAIFEQFEKR